MQVLSLQLEQLVQTFGARPKLQSDAWVLREFEVVRELGVMVTDRVLDLLWWNSGHCRELRKCFLFVRIVEEHAQHAVVVVEGVGRHG